MLKQTCYFLLYFVFSALGQVISLGQYFLVLIFAVEQNDTATGVEHAADPIFKLRLNIFKFHDWVEDFDGGGVQIGFIDILVLKKKLAAAETFRRGEFLDLNIIEVCIAKLDFFLLLLVLVVLDLLFVGWVGEGEVELGELGYFVEDFMGDYDFLGEWWWF